MEHPIPRHPQLRLLALPVSERPRERLAAVGAESLSELELLACVLGRGIAGESVLVTAQRVLAACDGARGLADISLEQLCAIRGIGIAKATQLKAAVELARRLATLRATPSPLVETAEQAAAIVRPWLADKKKEHFVALLLDTRHRLIRRATISIGSLSASLVHPRELFKDAIAASAAAVILAHNHPSGDATPSDHDVALTHRLVEAGQLLGIEVLDHLVIGSSETASLRGLGLLTPSGEATRRANPPARSSHTNTRNREES